jgi:hypothetical protein
LDWTIAAALITWLITLLGWYSAKRHADEREQRKEHRTYVDAIQSDVSSLLEAYLEYLSAGPDDVQREKSRIWFHALLNRLRRRVEFVDFEWSSQVIDGFADLYEAITGGNFEGNLKDTGSALRLHSTAAACGEQLLEAIEQAFKTAYGRRWYHKIQDCFNQHKSTQVKNQ